MKKKSYLILLAIVLLTPLLAQSVNAMSSDNYAIEWYTPLNSNGGGISQSTNYAINFTIGQTTIGGSSSTNYTAGLGYWFGILLDWLIYLPILIR